MQRTAERMFATADVVNIFRIFNGLIIYVGHFICLSDQSLVPLSS